YLGRANYSYDDKYFLTATYRRDGDSKLSKQHRWGDYYSVSGAWRISNEPFFKSSWVNDLKIRANYGQLGNAAIGSGNSGHWDYMNTVNSNIVTVFGIDQALINGATQVRIVNEDLRWERTEQANIGLDAEFLSNRLGVTAEYYNSTTKDVLTAMQISMATGHIGDNPLA